MLLNHKGQEVNVQGHLGRAREAVLAPLREVLVQDTKKCGTMFNIETRARIHQVQHEY